MSTTDDERPAFEWETRFRDNDTPWERGDLHPAARMWMDQGVLAAGKSVVIPGCGRCPEVAAFARAGLKVIAADLSDTAMAWQKSIFLEEKLSGEFIEGDILRPGDQRWYPEDPVDLVYDQTFLCAIPPRLREHYVYGLTHCWMKPGGQYLALFMQKEERGGPPYGCPLDAMRELFSDRFWIWPEDEDFIDIPHPSLNGKPELAGVLTRR